MRWITWRAISARPSAAVQQAMLRSAGPKWGRGVMPDQSQAQDLEDLLHLPDAALHKLTSGGGPPAHTVAPSADPVAMIMPPKAGLRELGKPKFETGATLSEKYKVRPPRHIPSTRVNYKLSSCQLV